VPLTPGVIEELLGTVERALDVAVRARRAAEADITRLREQLGVLEREKMACDTSAAIDRDAETQEKPK